MIRLKIILLGVAAGLAYKLSTDHQFGREFVHNVIIHPFMMVLPRHIANELHDRNGDWAFGQTRFNELALEQGRKQGAVT